MFFKRKNFQKHFDSRVDNSKDSNRVYVFLVFEITFCSGDSLRLRVLRGSGDGAACPA